MFYSSKSSRIGLVFIGTGLLPLLLTFFEGSKEGIIVGFLLSIVLGGFFAWLWAGTYYKITDRHLYYRSGPFNGKIPLDKIRKIEPKRYLIAGMRPALDFNGLVITYNKYNEIYLSPARKSAFIEQLLLKNSAIEVSEDQKPASFSAKQAKGL